MDCSMPGFSVLLSPRVCPNSCQLSWWCYPTIISSAALFSCSQSVPASGSFPVSWFFASDGQNIGALASTSVLAMNIQGWFQLGLTGLILQSKGLSRVFSELFVSSELLSLSLSLHLLPSPVDIELSGWKRLGCSIYRVDQPRQHIKKQRHYFANKGLSSQSYGFSNSHVWM